ncbi:MAG: AAA family ATPase [Candidatus Bipolaricaulota bacterium]|nr:MAG: AAA family ATPase [Candidatus Bipolaricaulota bacterium]
MSLTIAVAGKGGTGKTTVSSLMVRALLARGMAPLLAVDADPNSNLGETLGVEASRSIGRLQAETLKQIHDLPAGVPLGRHLEYELHQAIEEGEGVDLLVMGHGEGPGCYCAVNHILRKYLETLRSAYRCTILDNEAGLEHLSRRVSSGIDVLLVVSDGNPAALRAAGRIDRMVDDLELAIRRRFLVLNGLTDGLTPRAEEEIAAIGLAVVGRVPHDPMITEMNGAGRPIGELPAESAALREVSRLVDKLLEKEDRA